MASLKLYGAPMSQPFRAAAWSMLQLGVPFDIQLAIPGMKNKYGTKHDNYRRLTPHQSSLIPILQYSSSKGDAEELSPTVIVESAAIMTHICERYGGQARAGNTRGGPVLYPQTGSLEKAMVDSYIHWHHAHTRSLTNKFYPKILPHLGVKDSPEFDKKVEAILEQVDSGWLHSDEENRPYIGGLSYATIADMMAYSEIATVGMMGLISLENHSRLRAWMDRMAQQPFHDDVHKAILMMGKLEDNEDPAEFEQRLKAATKGGLKSIAAAQANFAPIPDWEV